MIARGFQLVRLLFLAFLETVLAIWSLTGCREIYAVLKQALDAKPEAIDSILCCHLSCDSDNQVLGIPSCSSPFSPVIFTFIGCGGSWMQRDHHVTATNFSIFALW